MGSLKAVSFGACAIASYSPKREKFTSNTKIINITVKFEEALRLNLALSECIRKLNKYKRNTKVGKRAAVNLVLHVGGHRLAVAEGKV